MSIEEDCPDYGSLFASKCFGFALLPLSPDCDDEKRKETALNNLQLLEKYWKAPQFSAFIFPVLKGIAAVQGFTLCSELNAFLVDKGASVRLFLYLKDDKPVIDVVVILDQEPGDWEELCKLRNSSADEQLQLSERVSLPERSVTKVNAGNSDECFLENAFASLHVVVNPR